MTASAAAVKCVVWDLDRTLWSGVLGEGDDVVLTPGARAIVEALDARGVLQSIASRSDPAPALARLAALGVQDYFLSPQIGWTEKTASLEVLARELDLPLDALLFIDDDPFEREAVRFAHPEVRCVAAEEIGTLLDRADLRFAHVTDDARQRRLLYQRESMRRRDEAAFVGPRSDFLRTLGMTLTIAAAVEGDLERAAELTVRTHQLNTTGLTYGVEELAALARSPAHRLFVCRLTDRYGDHGRIGLALVAVEPGLWSIKLLLLSCRVLARNLGSSLITYLLRAASEAGARLEAEIVPTDRNRQMMITYRFAGFRRVRAEAGRIVLEHDLRGIPDYPDHVVVLG